MIYFLASSFIETGLGYTPVKLSPLTLTMFGYAIFFFLFYPITLEGRRGTTDEFATIPFHLDLFSAALVELARSMLPLLEIDLHIENDLFPPLFSIVNNINGDLNILYGL